VEAADAELTLRRARRFVWAFRLIFYPGAALVAFLVLSRSSGPEGLARGTTQQGYEFVMQFDGDRPLWFETSITERCPAGQEATQHWASTQRLEVRDGVLDVETTAATTWSTGTGEVTMRLRARVDDGAVTGTLWVSDRFGDYVCEAGPVTVSAD
jgi:hypothetical protein